MKEYDNSPEEELNEMEASNLSDIEFNIMVIMIIKNMKKYIETKKSQK